MKIVLWNIEWSEPSSVRGQRLLAIIRDFDPDVLCLTETPLEMLPAGGHSICSGADYGYPNHGKRRKVALWSKTPWTEPDAVGAPAMPEGRYISGVTGGIRFTGVCIPWRDAHVRTGRKDRTPWQDHKTYLTGLAPVLQAQLQAASPVCLLGDFNQRIPKLKQPSEVYASLMTVLQSGLTCATSRERVPDHELIDHVAIDSRLRATVLQVIPKTTGDGVRLSDHDGIVAEITPC